MNGKKTKKRAAAAAAAVIAAAGTVVGGSFDSPMDLMNADGGLYASDTAAELNIDEDSGAVDGGEERTRRGRIRRLAAALPAGVRALVGVPLWCVGWLVITLVSGLWSVVVSPLVGTALKWLLAAAIMLALLLVMLKIVFPDMPLSRLFNKKSVLTALLGVAVVGVLDALLGIFLPDERSVLELVRFFGTMTVFTLSALPLISGEVKRRREAAGEESREDKDKRLRRQALELARSVERK